MSLAKKLLSVQPAASGGDFAPGDIAGLEVWYDASDDDSFTYSSGTVVSQWDDLSGNDRHLTQSTVAQQPDRSATVNGLDGVQSNTVDFSGSNMTSSAWNLSQPFTVFNVAQRGTSIPTYSVLWQSKSGSRPIIFARRAEGSGVPNFYAGTLRTWGPQLTSGERFVFTNVFDGASSEGRKNGAVESIAGSPGTGGIQSGVRLGASGEWFGGIWCESIVYDGALSADDIDSVETYLADKWGITI